MTITSNNFSTIYKLLLDEIYNNPDFVDINPRGLKTKEKTNVEIALTNPTSNLFTNDVRSPDLRYLYGELLYYFLGRNDLQFISKYSSFWSKIANDDGTVNSAYGNLLFKEKNKYGFTEWEWAYKSLIKDKATRQALIRFNKPHHSFDGNKDFVCTLDGLFLIRDNKLYFTTTMRSQDMWFGIIYDIPFFTLLQQQMRLHLLEIFPDLELGTYRHYIFSAHIYEKDFKYIENMLLNKFDNARVPTIDINYPLITKEGYPTRHITELELYSLGVNTEFTFNNDLLYNEFKKRL